jgi:hypothetical protein
MHAVKVDSLVVCINCAMSCDHIGLKLQDLLLCFQELGSVILGWVYIAATLSCKDWRQTFTAILTHPYIRIDSSSLILHVLRAHCQVSLLDQHLLCPFTAIITYPKNMLSPPIESRAVANMLQSKADYWSTRGRLLHCIFNLCSYTIARVL